MGITSSTLIEGACDPVIKTCQLKTTYKRRNQLINYRYNKLTPLGDGSYGFVVSAEDAVNGTIKISIILPFLFSYCFFII